MKGPSWSSSCGSWIYNQCLSQLKLLNRIDTTLCDTVCQWLVSDQLRTITLTLTLLMIGLKLFLFDNFFSNLFTYIWFEIVSLCSFTIFVNLPSICLHCSVVLFNNCTLFLVSVIFFQRITLAFSSSFRSDCFFNNIILYCLTRLLTKHLRSPGNQK